jgi:hypothetical protein
MPHEHSWCYNCEGTRLCVPVIQDLDVCETVGECIVRVICDLVETCYQSEPGGEVIEGGTFRMETCSCSN